MYFLIGGDGKTYGPVELPVLKQWCLDGRVAADTQVLDPIDEAYRRADQIPEIARYVQITAPPKLFSPSFPRYGTSPAYRPQTAGVQGLAELSKPPSKGCALLLAVLFGVVGVHRLYMGHLPIFLVMFAVTLLTCGTGLMITVPWVIVDIFLIIFDGVRDDKGRRLTWP